MLVLICSHDVTPCPVELQQWREVDQAFTPGNLGIDAAGVLYVCSWGVGVVLLLFSLGYGVGAALKAIRLL